MVIVVVVARFSFSKKKNGDNDSDSENTAMCSDERVLPALAAYYRKVVASRRMMTDPREHIGLGIIAVADDSASAPWSNGKRRGGAMICTRFSTLANRIRAVAGTDGVHTLEVSY
eukprot:1838800-Pyramimonas_sp.AAC.4